jgi:cellulose synthase/poly-beta-1,6-N-acetylglucosamine synthase-like glycosyltransferase
LTILTFIAWVCALGYILFAVLVLYGLAKRKPLGASYDLSDEIKNQPLVSVLVPARNEADRILPQSVGSILDQDYENLEVIAVNDRSTDETESILRSMAKTGKRLRVINAHDPPAGWLGKPNALEQALQAARGEWILTVDADMMLERSAIRIAMRRALEKNLDILTLMPHFETGSFWERVITPAWICLILGAFPFALLNHPKWKKAIAFGGFSLIRREALARIGNFAAVRAEVVEDIRLAELLKNSGAAYRIEHAPDLLRTRMYKNLSGIWNSLLRVMFAGANYSFPLAIFAVIIGYSFVIAPPLIAFLCAVLLLTGASNDLARLFVPCFIIWTTQILILFFACKNSGIPVRYALTTPLGFSLFYTSLLVSAFKITVGKGIAWKERTVYERGAGISAPKR